MDGCGINWAKNWNRKSQTFKVRQGHPRTILGKVIPPGSFQDYFQKGVTLYH